MRELRYAGGHLDRAGSRRAHEGWVAAMRGREDALALPVWRDRNLVSVSPGGTAVPAAALLRLREHVPLCDDALGWALLGLDGDVPVFAVDVSSLDEDRITALSGDSAFVDLRHVGTVVSATDAALMAHARGLLGWHRRSRHCGVCGSLTQSRDAGYARRCSNPECSADVFPRTDPAVIMLVDRVAADGTRSCLLGRHARLPPGVFSTLAGFVEPGESLEETVAREVREESGIVVADVTYVASQPWPFPSSLMIGFRARAITEDIVLGPEELEEAHWFTVDQLATFGEWNDESARLRLPRRDSIARQLIDDWLSGQ